jgi:hypothetical protein
MRFPVRRVLLGFAAGATAGWVAGLLRSPAHAPAGSSADEAAHLPQEDFGTPAEITLDGAHPAPRKATGPAVKPPPGSSRTREVGASGHAGAAEPAAGPDVAAEVTVAEAANAAAEPTVVDVADAPAKAAAPRKPRRRPAKKTAPDPAEAAAAALREGHAEATERLADAEAEATPPPDDPGPARRRRRTT